MSQSDQIRDEPLEPCASEEAYALTRAALEWQLTSPIVIRSADDIVSTRWRGRVQPFHHQVLNLIRFCRLAPAVLIADEVGLGKTVSAALILSELMARRRVARALVVCPNVLCDQWVGELWNLFDLDAVAAPGREKFMAAVGGRAAVVVTTYQTAGRYLSEVERDEFQMLILDEAHHMRNLFGTNSTPQFANNLRDAVEERRDGRYPRFPYVLMLTATPVQNRLADIYSLLDVLARAKGHAHPLGVWANFTQRYVQPGTGGRRLRREAAGEFRQHLGRYLVRTRRADAQLPFPTRRVEPALVPLGPAERELMQSLGRVIGRLDPLTQTSLAEALMSSPAALATQLEKAATAHTTLRSLATVARAVADGKTPSAKLSRLFAICEAQRNAAPAGWRVVVFTRRRETQRMIQRALTANGIEVGLIAGGRAAENAADIARFMADPPGVRVLVSTDAGAEGVNLQQANVLVNYDLPWNPMVLEQRIGRVQRLRSPHKFVVVYNLIAQGTVEEAVVGRLLERLRLVADAVGGVESLLAETDDGAHDWAERSFESQVRNMVILSLQGQDVTRAAAMVEANIQAARREYEEHHGRMNADLGNLDTPHEVGQPPAFDRPPPSIPAEQFVLRALAQNGAELCPVAPGLYRDARRPNRPLVATNPAAANAHTDAGRVLVYAPGHPAFEELVDLWATRRGQRLADRTTETATAAERMAREWCETYPDVKFVRCVIRSRRAVVQGRVLVRVEAENRVDRHQRLVELPVLPEGHRQLPPASHTVVAREALTLARVSSHAARRVASALASDPELNAFTCYYGRRMVAELDRAGANPNLRRRVEDDFGVRTSAEVVGFHGDRYDEVIVDVTFEVEDGHYDSTLLLVPAAGQVIEKPSEERCPETGLRMPFNVLDRSDRTGRLVPKHRLFRSAFTGRQAEQELMARCEITNRLAVDDELETSAVSKVRAYRDHFVTCALSQVRILPEESGVSDYSGVVVRKNLLRQSERPPHRCGVGNEFLRCHVTGRVLLQDEVAMTALSRRQVDRELLVASEKSGRLGLGEETARCDETGRLLLTDEVGKCKITGRRVDIDLLARSEASGRRGLRDLLIACAETKRLAFPDELETCSQTNLTVLPDQLGQCAVTGQKILRRLLMRCAVSGDLIAPSEAAQSDYSLRWVRKTLLRQSARSPGRSGTEDEFGVCVETGRNLLRDELQETSSGRLVDSSLVFTCPVTLNRVSQGEAEVCEESQERYAPGVLQVCEATGKRVGETHLARSAASGRLVLRRLLIACAETSSLALPDEMATCSESGATVLPDRIGVCALTGRYLRRQLLVECAVTGDLIAASAAGRSDLSGRLARPNTLRRSERPPHRSGLPDEVGVCEVTGRALLTDELARSAVSGRLIDRDLLTEVHGVLVHPDELERCGVCDQLVHPDRLFRCEGTGVRAEASHMLQSAVSGRLVLRNKASRCEVSGVLVLADELEVCGLSGLRVVPTELETCAETGTRALRREMVRCADTGVWLVPAAAGRSDLRPRWVRKSLLRRSERSPGRYGTADEFGVCAETSRRLLRDELETTASGRIVDSVRIFTCPVSNRRASQGEAEECEVTGQRVAPSVLRRCATSGQRVLPSQLVRCSVTGHEVLATLAGRSDYSGRNVLRELLAASAKPPGRLGTADEFVTCAVSGARLLKDEVEKCQHTRKMVDRDLLLDCDGRRMIKTETGVCRWSGRRRPLSELEECKLTGLLVEWSYLDEHRMLRPLAQMLDGRQVGRPRADLLAPLRALDPAQLGRAESVRAYEGPAGDRVAACIEVTEKTFLGLSKRTLFLGCLLRTTPELKMIGRPVRGVRDDGEWTEV